MTGLSFLVIALGLGVVFAAFWGLVEATGGVAGSALSVLPIGVGGHGLVAPA